MSYVYPPEYVAPSPSLFIPDWMKRQAEILRIRVNAEQVKLEAKGDNLFTVTYTFRMVEAYYSQDSLRNYRRITRSVTAEESLLAPIIEHFIQHPQDFQYSMPRNSYNYVPPVNY